MQKPHWSQLHEEDEPCAGGMGSETGEDDDDTPEHALAQRERVAIATSLIHSRLEAIKSMKQALLKQTMEMISKLEAKPEDGKQRGGRHGRNKAGPMGQGALPSMQEQLAQQREDVACAVAQAAERLMAAYIALREGAASLAWCKQPGMLCAMRLKASGLSVPLATAAAAAGFPGAFQATTASVIASCSSDILTHTAASYAFLASTKSNQSSSDTGLVQGQIQASAIVQEQTPMPCQHLPLLPSLEALEGLLASGADACPDVCCMDGSDPDRDGCMEDVDAWGRGEQVGLPSYIKPIAAVQIKRVQAPAPAPAVDAQGRAATAATGAGAAVTAAVGVVQAALVPGQSAAAHHINVPGQKRGSPGAAGQNAHAHASPTRVHAVQGSVCQGMQPVTHTMIDMLDAAAAVASPMRGLVMHADMDEMHEEMEDAGCMEVIMHWAPYQHQDTPVQYDSRAATCPLDAETPTGIHGDQAGRLRQLRGMIAKTMEQHGEEQGCGARAARELHVAAERDGCAGAGADDEEDTDFAMVIDDVAMDMHVAHIEGQVQREHSMQDSMQDEEEGWGGPLGTTAAIVQRGQALEQAGALPNAAYDAAAESLFKRVIACQQASEPASGAAAARPGCDPALIDDKQQPMLLPAVSAPDADALRGVADAALGSRPVLRQPQPPMGSGRCALYRTLIQRLPKQAASRADTARLSTADHQEGQPHPDHHSTKGGKVLAAVTAPLLRIVLPGAGMAGRASGKRVQQSRQDQAQPSHSYDCAGGADECDGEEDDQDTHADADGSGDGREQGMSQRASAARARAPDPAAETEPLASRLIPRLRRRGQAGAGLGLRLGSTKQVPSQLAKALDAPKVIAEHASDADLDLEDEIECEDQGLTVQQHTTVHGQVHGRCGTDAGMAGTDGLPPRPRATMLPTIVKRTGRAGPLGAGLGHGRLGPGALLQGMVQARSAKALVANDNGSDDDNAGQGEGSGGGTLHGGGDGNERHHGLIRGMRGEAGHGHGHGQGQRAGVEGFSSDEGNEDSDSDGLGNRTALVQHHQRQQQQQQCAQLHVNMRPMQTQHPRGGGSMHGMHSGAGLLLPKLQRYSLRPQLTLQRLAEMDPDSSLAEANAMRKGPMGQNGPPGKAREREQRAKVKVKCVYDPEMLLHSLPALVNPYQLSLQHPMVQSSLQDIDMLLRRLMGHAAFDALPLWPAPAIRAPATAHTPAPGLACSPQVQQSWGPSASAYGPAHPRGATSDAQKPWQPPMPSINNTTSSVPALAATAAQAAATASDNAWEDDLDWDAIDTTVAQALHAQPPASAFVPLAGGAHGHACGAAWEKHRQWEPPGPKLPHASVGHGNVAQHASGAAGVCGGICTAADLLDWQEWSGPDMATATADMAGACTLLDGCAASHEQQAMRGSDQDAWPGHDHILMEHEEHPQLLRQMQQPARHQHVDHSVPCAWQPPPAATTAAAAAAEQHGLSHQGYQDECTPAACLQQPKQPWQHQQQLQQWAPPQQQQQLHQQPWQQQEQQQQQQVVPQGVWLMHNPEGYEPHHYQAHHVHAPHGPHPSAHAHAHAPHVQLHAEVDVPDEDMVADILLEADEAYADGHAGCTSAHALSPAMPQHLLHSPMHATMQHGQRRSAHAGRHASTHADAYPSHEVIVGGKAASVCILRSEEPAKATQQQQQQQQQQTVAGAVGHVNSVASDSLGDDTRLGPGTAAGAPSLVACSSLRAADVIHDAHEVAADVIYDAHEVAADVIHDAHEVAGGACEVVEDCETLSDAGADVIIASSDASDSDQGDDNNSNCPCGMHRGVFDTTGPASRKRRQRGQARHPANAMGNTEHGNGEMEGESSESDEEEERVRRGRDDVFAAGLHGIYNSDEDGEDNLKEEGGSGGQILPQSVLAAAAAPCLPMKQQHLRLSGGDMALADMMHADGTAEEDDGEDEDDWAACSLVIDTELLDDDVGWGMEVDSYMDALQDDCTETDAAGIPVHVLGDSSGAAMHVHAHAIGVHAEIGTTHTIQQQLRSTHANAVAAAGNRDSSSSREGMHARAGMRDLAGSMHPHGWPKAPSAMQLLKMRHMQAVLRARRASRMDLHIVMQLLSHALREAKEHAQQQMEQQQQQASVASKGRKGQLAANLQAGQRQGIMQPGERHLHHHRQQQQQLQQQQLQQQQLQQQQQQQQLKIELRLSDLYQAVLRLRHTQQQQQQQQGLGHAADAAQVVAVAVGGSDRSSSAPLAVASSSTGALPAVAGNSGGSSTEDAAIGLTPQRVFLALLNMAHQNNTAVAAASAAGSSSSSGKRSEAVDLACLWGDGAVLRVVGRDQEILLVCG